MAKTQFEIINNITKYKEYLEKLDKRGLALDIDETLSYTIKYWWQELSMKFGNPEDLGVEEVFAKYNYYQNYWTSEEALAWMNNASNDNNLVERLELIPDADNFVSTINKIKPIFLYPTNRPESVAEGTIKWLTKHNFPPAGIAFRPLDIKPEDGYKRKAEILNFLYPYIEGIVDDQSTLVKFLPKTYKGTLYLYNNSDIPETNIKVVPCKTWEEVLRQVRK